MKPGHDPDTVEDALTLVEEECSELAIECMSVVKAISKARRFGLNGYNPTLPEVITNEEALALEICDVRVRTGQLLLLLERSVRQPRLPRGVIDRMELQLTTLEHAAVTIQVTPSELKELLRVYKRFGS